MKCPNCQSEMEREDCYGVLNDMQKQPSANYVCFDCGFDCVWVRNERLIVRFDPRDLTEPYGIESFRNSLASN